MHFVGYLSIILVALSPSVFGYQENLDIFEYHPRVEQYKDSLLTLYENKGNLARDVILDYLDTKTYELHKRSKTLSIETFNKLTSILRDLSRITYYSAPSTYFSPVKQYLFWPFSYEAPTGQNLVNTYEWTLRTQRMIDPNQQSWELWSSPIIPEPRIMRHGEYPHWITALDGVWFDQNELVSRFETGQWYDTVKTDYMFYKDHWSFSERRTKWSTLCEFDTLTDWIECRYTTDEQLVVWVKEIDDQVTILMNSETNPYAYYAFETIMNSFSSIK